MPTSTPRPDDDTGHAEQHPDLIDQLIDGGAYWQAKWRRDGSTLSDAAIEMQLEILALRQQLREHGITPAEGAWSRRADRSLPFITERLHPL